MGRLFWKFFLAFWFSLMSAGVGIGATVWLYRQTVESPDLAMGPLTSHMASSAIATLKHGGIAALRDLLLEWQQGGRAYVFVVDASGRELLDRPVSQTALAEARAEALSGADSHFARQVATIKGEEYLFFVPAAEQPMPERLLSPASGRPVPLLPVFSILLASLGFSALMAWYLARPIRTLRWAFDAAAAGHLETRVGHLIRRRDEIADLCRDFDRMARQIQAVLEAQRRLQHDISHELRSPLARLQVAIGLARQNPQKIETSLERIEREAGRLDALVGELLTLSRLESGTASTLPERVNLVELVAAAVDDARYEARAAGRDVVFRGEGEVLVDVRIESVHRAVENVLRNAIKFTLPGIAVEVAVTVAESEAKVAISDHGGGVAEGDLDAIFQPFYRCGKSGSADGFGLGLAIARQALSMHGGRIRATNRSGGGLCVELSLPLAACGRIT